MLLLPLCRRQWFNSRLIAASVCVGASGFFMVSALEAKPKVADKRQYNHLLQFITIPASDLPKNVRIKEKLHGAPIIPLRYNPEVFVDPKAFSLIAKFFQIESPESEPLTASVVAVYQESEAANEIGVYGIYFLEQKSADEHFKKLLRTSKERAKNRSDFPFIQKGRLLLYVWRDEGVSNHAFKAVQEYFRTKKFELADRH